jgi:DnaK suppressor protein
MEDHMNLEHYKKLLLARQTELTKDVKRYDAEVLDSQVSEVGDNSDVAVSDQAKSAAADLSSTAEGELGLVQDALKRIQNGTYGKCVDCGETIPPARLEAVPWAPYCLKDQEIHDRAQGTTKPATL